MGRTLKPGVYGPLPTFFDDQQEIDYASYKDHLLRLAEKGIGSLGEAVHLSPDERIQLVQFIRTTLDDAGLQSTPIVAGVGGSSTRETIRLANDAAKAGADAGLVILPAYYAASLTVDTEQIVQYYVDICAGSPIPLFLYNFPANSAGLDMSAATIEAIIKRAPNLCGAKLTCGGSVGKLVCLTSLIQSDPAINASRPSPFLLLDGAIADLTPWVQAGGHGTVSGISNFAPRATMRLWHLLQRSYGAGDDLSDEEKREMHRIQAILARADAYAMPAGVRGMKYVLNKLRAYGPAPRRPLLPLGVEQGDALVEVFDAITQDSRPAKSRRITRACLQCRSRKQRCLPVPSSPGRGLDAIPSLNAPCQRCVSHRTTCSFETDRRETAEPEIGPSRLSQLVVDLHHRINVHEARIKQLEAEAEANSARPSKTPTSTPGVAPARQHASPQWHSPRQNADFNMDTLQLAAPIATLRSLGAISPPESMHTQPPDGHRHLAAPARPYDPVHLGIVTRGEACHAMKIYFEYCHPWAPFLDCELVHKGHELGNDSPLLFLAVVCIGAQFWTPQMPVQMHPRYFELAALFDKAVAQLLLTPVPSDATVDAVCALLLYSQWMPYLESAGVDSRAPAKSRYNDLSAWVIFGLAVRYASFLGLEGGVTRLFSAGAASFLGLESGVTRLFSAGSTAEMSRADFARARVWLNLVTYDCNLTLTSGLPASIDPMRMEAMARDFCRHRFAQFPGDLRYSALVELACIMQRARNGERKGGPPGRHPNIDVLKRANTGFEDWERHWLPQLQHTYMQHSQLPFTSLRWYQLALNSSALRRILSLTGEPTAFTGGLATGGLATGGPTGVPAPTHERQDSARHPQRSPVWVLGALETSLTAAAQILFSLSTGACTGVWHLASQDPATFPAGTYVVDQGTRQSLLHAVDSIWISHAFALIYIVLCYVRGRIDDDLQICSLTPPTCQTRRAPAKPRPTSIIARLAQLALDIFGCRDTAGSTTQASAFRPIDKISTLVANASSLVISPPPRDNSDRLGLQDAVTAADAVTDAVTDSATAAGAYSADHSDPVDLQVLFDLMGDSGMDWPAALPVFDEDSLNMGPNEWAF